MQKATFKHCLRAHALISKNLTDGNVNAQIAAVLAPHYMGPAITVQVAETYTDICNLVFSMDQADSELMLSTSTRA